MKNRQNITIALLAVTAVILAAIVVGTYTTDNAYAETSVKDGDYLMTVAQYSAARDLVCVVDMTARRMNTYSINLNTNSIELVDDTVDLDRSFAE